MIDAREKATDGQVELKAIADRRVMMILFHTSLEKIEEHIGKAFKTVFPCLGEMAEYPAGPCLAPGRGKPTR
jgi:hypothetical protein